MVKWLIGLIVEWLNRVIVIRVFVNRPGVSF